MGNGETSLKNGKRHEYLDAGNLQLIIVLHMRALATRNYDR